MFLSHEVLGPYNSEFPHVWTRKLDLANNIPDVMTL